MKKPWIWIICAVLVALLAGLFFWMRSNMVEKEERVYVGFHGQARRNPFLAAQRVLERLEVSTLSRPGFPSASVLQDDSDLTDQLVSPLVSLPQKPGHVAALRAWVSGGGVLVTGLTGGRFASPPLLTPEVKQLLGLQSFENTASQGKKALALPAEPEADPAPETDPQPEAATPPANPSKPGPADKNTKNLLDSLYEQEIELRLPWAELPDKVTANTTWRIHPSPASLTLDVKRPAAPFAIAHEVGDGWVIVLSDLDLLNNHNLPKGANATFLHRLANEATEVAFIYGWDSPTLSAYLWQEQRPALAALAALLAVGLTAAARRFGPIQPPPSVRRRELLEHIRAAGLNLFRHAGRGSLVLALRRRIRQRAILLHPAWSNLGDEALARELARHAGFDADRLVRAMTCPVTNRDELVETAATLHLLRQSLGRKL